MSSNIKIETDERGLFFNIKLIGSLSGVNVVQLRKTFEFTQEIGHTKIGLDLSEVDFIDSMGIGIVMNIFKKLKEFYLNLN